MKAIETVYNGYKFRSRLEARWAVFFDSMDIKYNYEPEGFDINGLWYLPDFYLVETELFIEIKPGLAPHKNKARAFGEAGGHIALIQGMPSNENDGRDLDILYFYDTNVHIFGDLHGWLFDARTFLAALGNGKKELYDLVNLCDLAFKSMVRNTSKSKVYESLEKARQARFEHHGRNGNQ